MAVHAQWNLFGHILRLVPNVPANKDMTAYFCHPGAGGMADQEPTVFNDNLKGTPFKLKSRKDLQLLQVKSEA